MSDHDPADREYAAHLRRGATSRQAADAFDDAVFETEDAAIPPKYRELIAIAVGATIQRRSCIDNHTQGSESRRELRGDRGGVMVAAAIRAGGGVTQGFLAMKVYQDASKPTTPTIPA